MINKCLLHIAEKGKKFSLCGISRSTIGVDELQATILYNDGYRTLRDALDNLQSFEFWCDSCVLMALAELAEVHERRND